MQISKIAICGTDLLLMKGDGPEVTDGRILGHVRVGGIEEIGASVTGFKPEHHVLISCISSCGKCEYCKK